MDISAGTKSKSEEIRTWISEIAAARKREKDWRKAGKEINSIYSGEEKDKIPFNILYSNTETLSPALYNSQPRPVVQRRFKDEDPLGKAAALAGQRLLEFSLDTNSEEYAAFDDVMADAVLDALLPGRGTTRIKYDAQIIEPQKGSTNIPLVKYEQVCYESIKWNMWTFGFAKKWKKVPWICLDHYIGREEAVELFGEAKAKELTYTAPEKEDNEEGNTPRKDESEEEERKVALVFEVWDRDGGKKVRFISPGYLSDYLKVTDDPLELTGFYPIPEPLRFLRKANDLMPTGLYTLYENQAKELNDITRRINKIVNALKVRGVYDSTLGELATLFDKDDNTLVPAENVAAMQDLGSLDKAIWLVPIEKLIVVLQQLLLAREQAKQVIYEITGVSDILRGQSVASETATAQQIKNQWGTLRLKRMQRQVQSYVRTVIRIALEIAAKKFSVKTVAAMTGLPFPTKEVQDQMQTQARTMQLSGQQPTPEQQQQYQQVMGQPNWEQVLETLRNDTQRQYRIDIETNSTVDLEATEDQKNIAEVMTAVSQFLQGMAPLVISKSMPFQAVQSMLLAIVRRYRFGTEIEDQIKAMQEPQPPNDGKQQQAAHDAQMAQMELQQKAQNDSHELALKARDQQNELLMSAKQAQFDQQAQAQELASKERIRMMELAAEERAKQRELQNTRATAEMQAKLQQQTAITTTTLQVAAQKEIALINAAAKKESDDQKAAAAEKDKKAEESSKATSDILNGITELLSQPREYNLTKDAKGRTASIISIVGGKK